MNTQTLLLHIQTALENVKAHNIVQFSTETKSPLFEKMVIASGNSSRQVQALAMRAAQEVKKNGGNILGIEGSEGWVLVDFGSVLLNIMTDEARNYYQLEELWRE